MYQSSFLKWAGGKKNALPHIFAHLPRSGEVFVEPFAGSCTASLNTDYKHYILNDSNEDLINALRSVRDDPTGILADLNKLFIDSNNNQLAFASLRDEFNTTTDSWKRAVLFIYLNRHCYNGLMRYNKSGGFNTSFGKYKKPLLPKDAIVNFAQKFKHADIIQGSFSALDITLPNCVVYCDPPYIPASKTASFVGYTDNGFKEEDHRTLDLLATQWKGDGHQVFISNSDTASTNTVYSGRDRAFSFGVRRSISQLGGKRGYAAEVLMQY